MASVKSKVRLRVPWDVATNAIEAVVEDDTRVLEVVQRDNGYLELRGSKGISLYVNIRVEGQGTTVVSVIAKQSRRLLPLGRGPRLETVITDFLASVKLHALSDRMSA